MKDRVINTENLIDSMFSKLESELVGNKEINIDFQQVTFISVSSLERIEQFIERAKEFNVVVKLQNVNPSVYKVFQVARAKYILNIVS